MAIFTRSSRFSCDVTLANRWPRPRLQSGYDTNDDTVRRTDARPDSECDRFHGISHRWAIARFEQLRESGLSGRDRRRKTARRQVLPPGALDRRTDTRGA